MDYRHQQPSDFHKLPFLRGLLRRRLGWDHSLYYQRFNVDQGVLIQCRHHRQPASCKLSRHDHLHRRGSGRLDRHYE